MSRQDPNIQFSFGPTGRGALKTYRFPWARALLSLALFVALAFVLMFMVAGPAHAGTQTQELKAAAERLNSTCRDDPKAVGACAARDGVLAQLKRAGHCWNSQAPTPAMLWVPCGQRATTDVCEINGEIAFTLALYRDTGIVPQVAYAKAVEMARRSGLSPAPLQAMTWAVYVDLGAKSPDGIRRLSRFECRKARGML